MRLVSWTPADLLRRLDDVIAAYGEAMGYSDELLATRRGYVAAHVHRPGFRAVATLTDEGALAGFGYGYTCRAGQWWHDQVNAALPPPRRQWLVDCFEIVELHVRPAAQGRQLGAAQLIALLATTPAATAVLSTPEADESGSRAWRLYRRFGFVDVLRQFHFPGDGRPFAVLGRRLPLTAEAGRPGATSTRPAAGPAADRIRSG
ncbi:GNAT family N-acetyltransferase [Pilimelia columellifera]|uniref:GNAT family N-acetyltransferase n=1 Tax=Pilimelia columellifera subsp. columellifera TaxID=706583 RepID=A0ABN3NDP4_9ACTN